MFMRYVATLIANPAKAKLDNTILTAARGTLAAAGANPGMPAILAPGIAADLPFDGLAPEDAAGWLRDGLSGERIDVITQEAATRRKSLLVSDMESTIIDNEMLDELAEMRGLADRVAPITARAMNGEIDFRQALTERVGLLAGLTTDQLDEAYAKVRVKPGARALVRTMRAHGGYAALVSGGFRVFTARVREAVGFNEDVANDLAMKGSQMTGRLADGPIIDATGKREALFRLLRQRKLPREASLAVGDGANDIPMLQSAGLGVAFRPRPKVAAVIPQRLDYADLTALLYAQGYAAKDIAPDS